ncbi:MAG: LysE family transporter [Reyranella sp.]|nr:LysE family transporter [Reyranella sp.]
MAGVAAGLAFLMIVASTGLIVLLQAVPSLHLVVKVLGSAYLIWLCWKSVASLQRAMGRAC